jgi:hypothetical protein
VTAKGMGIALKATLLQNRALRSCSPRQLAVYEILAHGAIIYAEMLGTSKSVWLPEAV